MFRRTFILGATAGIALLSACRSQMPLSQESYVEGLNMKQVQEAIEKGAAQQKWKTELVRPGYIVATYQKGPHIACVDIHFEGSGFRITENPKTNLREPNGKVHSKYNQWVLDLDKAIRDQAAQTGL